MNVADEQSRSCWMKNFPDVAAPPLVANAECHMVVIGSGIAALSTAYELQSTGSRRSAATRTFRRTSKASMATLSQPTSRVVATSRRV